MKRLDAFAAFDPEIAEFRSSLFPKDEVGFIHRPAFDSCRPAFDSYISTDQGLKYLELLNSLESKTEKVLILESL